MQLVSILHNGDSNVVTFGKPYHLNRHIQFSQEYLPQRSDRVVEVVDAVFHSWNSSWNRSFGGI